MDAQFKVVFTHAAREKAAPTAEVDDEEQNERDGFPEHLPDNDITKRMGHSVKTAIFQSRGVCSGMVSP